MKLLFYLKHVSVIDDIDMRIWASWAGSGSLKGQCRGLCSEYHCEIESEMRKEPKQPIWPKQLQNLSGWGTFLAEHDSQWAKEFSSGNCVPEDSAWTDLPNLWESVRCKCKIDLCGDLFGSFKHERLSTEIMMMMTLLSTDWWMSQPWLRARNFGLFGKINTRD